ncbi:histone H1-like [Genypterus blacodes]|uniref:histone H1-like n=1 Tax=Genypterus blacodes TaxID=154954 RepID=UPI003F7609BF
MGETAPAVPAVQAKSPKKRTVKPRPAGPKLRDLVLESVAASTERNGISLAALKKSLTARGYDVEKNNARVKLAVKGLVTAGALDRTKGTGASGSFKLTKKPKESAAKAKKPAIKKPAAAPKAKKPAAKSAAKKLVAEKSTAKKGKKVAPAAKKVAVKAKSAKSPKKVTKKAATPKKAPKKAVKPRAAPKSRKTPTKRAAKK